MDKFHEKGDRIYMVWRNMVQASGQINTTSGIPQPLELVLENEYSEVDQVTLLGWEMEVLVQNNDKIFREKGDMHLRNSYKCFPSRFLPVMLTLLWMIYIR